MGIEVYGENIPKDHISHFIVDFIEENYKLLNIEEKEKTGKNPFPIVLYSNYWFIQKRTYRKC